MEGWKAILGAGLVLFLVDLIWLNIIGGAYSSVVETIQGGRGIHARLWAGAVVYIALAFVLLKNQTLWEAFSTGVASYAVYDFTVMALFKDYPLWIGIADTLWGGVLFSISHLILKKLGGFY